MSLFLKKKMIMAPTKLLVVSGVLMFVFLLLLLSNTEASTVEELQVEIEQRQTGIQALEAEIAEYQQELQRLSRESDTLENEIQRLEISRKKLEADISLTENRVAEKNRNIQDLNGEIINREERIERGVESMSETIRRIDQAENRSIVSILLSFENIGDIFNEMEELERLQEIIRSAMEELTQNKKELEDKKKDQESKREELRQLQRELGGQQEVVEYSKQEQESLLNQTQSTEAEYQRLVRERREQKEAFERDLFEFESQINMLIDPSSVPSARPGVLQWPLDNIVVTQFFGDTEFARTGAYSGRGHNGVDFRATTGTPVRSALNGVVKAVHNTDNVPGCLSFGRWILVTHNNGLSTLYSHLSSSLVSPGEEVKTGQVIGLSGGSPGTPGAGYSTGPHLHFGVYASQGVAPKQFVSNTPCNGAMMPLADLRAYKDPMEFLPPLN